ncbi:MAG: acyclic terpene utilization AtuA family protein [Vicinamibacterales bacterium]
MKTIRIGGGAGFSGDRIEPAVALANDGELDYLVFECLAERTIALAQQAKARDPASGYDPLLVPRIEAVLPACHRHGVTIISNMGAANPPAAGAAVAAIARRLGMTGLAIATVSGDNVLEVVTTGNFVVAETGEPVAAFGDRLLSANAYIGAEALVEALAGDADVVITGRAADPALFVAPLVHEFGWAWDDWTALGRGTLVGHLLECAGQVTGGYFADPGCKDVDGLSRLGFPIAEVPEHGPIVITKLAGSGGAVTPATCKEQLLYEIHDPGAYLTPDVVADFSRVRITAIGRDRVAVDGAHGRSRPDQLKVSLGFRDGFIGEGQISYAGTGAVGRARLAARIVEERLASLGFAADEVRAEVIGISALHGGRISGADREPYEVRVRVAARAGSNAEAVKVGNEVEALYTNGPAGGGGATKSVREIVSVASTFVPRSLVCCTVDREVV